jgi:hypothetical protein
MGTNEVRGAAASQQQLDEVWALLELNEVRQHLLEAELRQRMLELESRADGQALITRLSKLTALFGQLEERVRALEDVLRSVQQAARHVPRRRRR